MADIKIVNKMEQGVFAMIDELFAREKGQCTCERCRMDVTALALNSLPPKYVVTEFGDVMTNVDLVSSQWRTDIMMAIYKAMEVVKSRPRH
jgi:competence protein ComFB